MSVIQSPRRSSFVVVVAALVANMIKNRVPCKGKIKLQIVTIYLSNIQP